MLVWRCHPSILLVLVALCGEAGTITVPAAPESPFVDTEAVTNAVVRPSLIQRARTFSGDIALNTTPSNALEVAFGISRNGDGILLPGDETFSLGWADGAWFIASPTNRIATAVLVGATRRSLSFSVRMSEEGVPTRLTVSADGLDDAFTSLTNAPPSWLFSRDWDAVRVTANGEPGFSGWQPISGNTWTARIAGTFEVRGHATADGRDVDVGPVVVQVRFPSETEMMEDPAIL